MNRPKPSTVSRKKSSAESFSPHHHQHAMSQHNVYRNGKIHVCLKQCETCIFRKGNRFHLEPCRLEEMTAGAIKADTAIICRSTLSGDNAVCRGFFNRHKTTPLQIAERMGVIEYQSAAPKEEAKP